MAEYVSGRRINQQFGVSGITTNDTVINVIGRVAVGIDNLGIGTTSATASIDTDTLRIRDTVIDSTGYPGALGYFLTKDVNGITWTAVPPLNNNAIFVASDGDIIGVSSFTGLNFVANDDYYNISTNTVNTNFADINVDLRWYRDRIGSGGIYTTTTVGIGSTIPRTSLGILTDIKLDIIGDASISGILSVGQLIGNINVVTEDLYVNGLSTFIGLSTFSTVGIGTTNIVDNDVLTIVGDAGLRGETDTFKVGSAITMSNGIVTATTFDGKFLDVDYLTVTGVATINSGIITDLYVTGLSTFGGSVNILDDLFVAGNVSVAGSSVILDAERLRIEDKDIVLGFTTTIQPNDTTGNFGGIAVASTDGSPLADLYVSGVNTLPNTYKQIKWVKSGSFSGMTTDAWISNYAISIGNTSIKDSIRLAVGSAITMSDTEISADIFYGKFLNLEEITTQRLNVTGISTLGFATASNLYVSGITTSDGGFIGNLTGTASTASFATTAFTLNNRVESEFNVATAVTSTNVIGGIASVTQFSVSGVSTLGFATVSNLYVSGITTSDGGFIGNLTGTASTASFATTAFSLNGISEGGLNVAFAQTSGIATNLKGGIGGNLPYQSATDTTTFVTNGAPGQVLLFNGSIPIWSNVSAATGSFGGITVYDEGLPVGTSNSITGLNIVGPNVSATATTGANGIATISVADYVSYASTAGIATYATSAGISTYSNTSGVSTSVIGGIASVTQLSVSGVSTLGIVKTGNIFSTGIVTALTFVGNLTGTASTASFATTAFTLNNRVESEFNVAFAQTSGISSESVKLQTPRTFEITGDVVASPITFDGTGNVSLAATIQPNSVELGTDTFGDYVESISGTANEIDVTGGTGEGSTPVISFAPNPLIGGNVTIGNDLQVNNNLNVTGNITVGGTAGYILVNEFRVTDSDIVLGFTTDISGNDVSNDTIANHGGIAVASTEGNPLVNLNIPGIETLPPTYKKIMWFKAGSFAGLNTDTWLSNYAIGIGSTQFPSGTRLAAGSVQITENDLAVLRNINASGIITGTLANDLTLNTSGNGISGIATYNNSGSVTFTVTSDATSANTAETIVYRDASGNFSAGTITADLTGVASTATKLETSRDFSISGDVATSSAIGFDGTGNVDLAVTLSNTFSANTSGIITATNFVGNLTGTATTATNLADAANITTGTINAARLTGTYNIDISGNAATATYATSSGIATYASTAGIATYASTAGIATYASTAGIATYATSSGIATYANTAGVSTNVIGGIASVTQLSVSGVSTFTGIGTFVSDLYVGGNVNIVGILTAEKLYSNIYGEFTGGGITGDSIVGTALSISGISTLGTVQISSGIITATSGVVTYYGDGSNLTGVSAVSADSYQFNVGLTSSFSAVLTGIGGSIITFPSTAGKQYIVHSIHAANVAAGNTEVNVTGSFDFNGGERSYFAYSLPIPTGTGLELLVQPQIMNPSDQIAMRGLDYNRNGADNVVEVYVTYQEKTSTEYIGVGLGTVGLGITDPIGIYTSSTYPSVIQSIRLTNRTDTGGYPISVSITSGVSTIRLVDNLIVPKYGSVEILETPKRLSVNDTIKVQVDQAGTIDVQVSGQQIV